MKSNETSVQDYWDSHSDIFGAYYKQPTWFDRTFRKAIFLRAMFALDACRELDAPSVLDVGSGPGVNSVALIKKGGAASVTGIDFSANMIGMARTYAASENLADRCTFIEGDFMAHDFQPGSFDLAIALGVFDYIADAPSCLDKMGRLARRRVVASWPEQGLRMMLRRLRYTCPVIPYSEEQIRQLHRNAGLEKVEFMKVPGGWVTSASH